LKNLLSAAFCVLLLGAFSQSASGASIGAGNPYPVSHYKCEDGTQLAVRLFGDRASVSVNGNAAIDLPSIGNDLAPKFYPVLSSLQRFWVAVFGAVAAGCGAEPFRLRSTASRRGLMV